MATDDEESHRLLQEFEVQDEDTKTQTYILSSEDNTWRNCCKFGLVKWHRIIYLMAAILAAMLLFNFGVVLAPSGDQSTSLVNNATSHLAIELNPKEHTSRPSTTLTFNWTITAGQRSPDGVEKLVYLVNDNFPGPTIEARSGDRLVIHVHNDLQEGTSLHWHGLRLKDQNPMDGAVGVTQCPIPPGGNFSYNFTIGDDEQGTFWWHSHSDGQRTDGLWGGLVVHSPEETSPPSNEFLIMVADWFHRSHAEVLAWFVDAHNGGNEPVPDSLLINGRGRFNCSMAVPARPLVCSQIAMRDLEALLPPLSGGLTRLRLVNTGSIAGFTMRLDGAKMEPIRVDGGCSVRSESSESVGVIYPGERVDMIVKSFEKHPKPRWLTIYMDTENFGYPNQALKPNESFPIFHDSERGESTDKDQAIIQPNEPRVLDSQNLIAATRVSGIPSKAELTFVFYAKTEKLAHFDYEPVGYINHTSWKPQVPPLLAQNRATWDENQLVPFVGISPGKATRVDIVINNLDDGAHPFHLHGSSFYVLSSYRNEGRGSWGSYNPYSGKPPPNGLELDFPVRKDTISVPRRGHVVLALLADNEGIWMLHCHMLVHLARGMAMAFHVGKLDDQDHISSQDLKAGMLCTN
ncbi:multicopper oxidase-domain-containing protein [Dactylonectria estremocensis]|uniref:Multicopper oxidase-domain-containing protein n=1 Tax=Dactylonectria estremocensis TaxID=1079267 RepID=A0A9P9IX76_9HYPO|nr:multicopper oxidase-domain-containing protein [Dactylonectria estremocensis]